MADMNSQDEYSCIVCRMAFSKQTHLATHYTACHSENISANFESETNVCSTSFGLVKCKNGSCTRYFNSRNGMHKHHGRIHGISLPDTRLAVKNKKPKSLIRYKSKSHATRLFKSRTRMITSYMHANGNSDEKTESTLKTESEEQCSDWLKPHNGGVEIQPMNSIASCLNKISADVNMEMASDCQMLNCDDLPIIVVSSGTTDIWDASCEDLLSEPKQNDQGSCAKQPDLAKALIKTEEFDIIE